MLEALKNALAPMEEKVSIGGVELVVREMPHAADVVALEDQTDLGYKILVRCVFDADGAPVFSDEDIPALKAAGKLKLAPLMKACNKVNGLLVEEAAKNSEAAPAGG